jgi:hypothetical protein
VAVGVYEAGHDNPVFRIDHLGTRCVDGLGNFDNYAVLDQDITAVEGTQGGVHG